MRMVRWAPKLRRLLPACWSVLVMNGAGGWLVTRFFSTEVTVNGGRWPRRPMNLVRFSAGPLPCGSTVV